MSARFAVAVSLVRAGYGAVLLARPDAVGKTLCGRSSWSPGIDKVARVLAARQLAQALVCGLRPRYAICALGVEVDLTHALSMAVVALAAPRWRRPACTSAVVAVGFATAGAASILTEVRQSRSTAKEPS